ncbi:MAG TPA: transglutaminase-like cysteine peptidase [Alphaproteobacteria bacterium]|nr:hypothetical protein [Rhodospirillaceae bacterium]HRJ12809.1 transglutaminase-like cysteine peptidase [Alphaproteobacteria bacterium]
MRAILAAALCVALSACAGDTETVSLGNGHSINVGPTRAISSMNAFAMPQMSGEIRTTGRAINDIGAYQRLKQSNPDLFAPRAGVNVSLETTDSINRRINDMISFEDDGGGKETWRALPSGGYGDCDDYAVTKLYHMISAGVPRSAMRLTVATSKQTGQWHLMLAVDVPGRGTFFMDNNNEHLLNASEARDLYTLWFMENTATLKMELVA